MENDCHSSAQPAVHQNCPDQGNWASGHGKHSQFQESSKGTCEFPRLIKIKSLLYLVGWGRVGWRVGSLAGWKTRDGTHQKWFPKRRGPKSTLEHGKWEVAAVCSGLARSVPVSFLDDERAWCFLFCFVFLVVFCLLFFSTSEFTV